MNNKPRQKLSVPRPWGHEQFLKGLMGKNIEVWIGEDDESMYHKGKLLNFDRYSILLERVNGKQILVFKNLINCIQEVA